MWFNDHNLKAPRSAAVSSLLKTGGRRNAVRLNVTQEWHGEYVTITHIGGPVAFTIMGANEFLG
jgi:hypothetical protein